MQILYYSYLSILWLIFWSFSSVLIYRWYNKKTWILNWRSECTNCHHKLGFFDLIPVFSYIFSRWKCRHCKAKISFIYPLLEISMWILFLLSWIYLTNYELIISLNYIEIFKLLFFLFVSFVIVTFTFYDILYMEIPDEIMIPAILIIFSILFIISFKSDIGLFNFYKTFDNNILNTPLINWVLWSLVIFLFFYFQILVSDWTWMGWWDLRIAIFMWLVAWFKIALLWLMLAYFIGSIFWVLIILKTKSRNTAIPFWPYLWGWLFISLLFYEDIITWYLNIL